MKRFERKTEPADFDARVRQRGMRWLAARPHGRPLPYWNEACAAVDRAFAGLCAYRVIHQHGCGSVDHFVSLDEDRALAYEWSNYRYCAGWLNSSKQEVRSDQILDPFEVEDEWFEITLPSLQLRVTDACPSALRAKAEFTIQRLKLRDGERAIRGRQALMELYVAGRLPIETMQVLCPLLARALRAV